MKVHWTESAIAHLVGVYEYIGKDSSVYASRMVDRITRRSEQFGSFPQSGEMVPEYQSKEIREVIEGPYRIIYRIKPDQIDVLPVVHGAMNLPSDI